jgi:hypothetical protein
MARLRPRIGPLGVALTLWDVYRRLPPQQRKMVLDLARKHGPKVASRMLELRRNTRRPK